MAPLYLVLGCVLIAMIAMVFVYHRKEFKMTSSTTGRVVEASNREIRNAHGRRDETVVILEFLAAGRTYQITQIFPGSNANRFPAGMQLTVRYNPGDPSMAKVQGVAA